MPAQALKVTLGKFTKDFAIDLRINFPIGHFLKDQDLDLLVDLSQELDQFVIQMIQTTPASKLFNMCNYPKTYKGRQQLTNNN